MRDEAQTQQQMYNTQVFFAFESEISEHMVYLKQFLRAALYNRKLTGVGDVFRNGVGHGAIPGAADVEVCVGPSRLRSQHGEDPDACAGGACAAGREPYQHR